MDLKQKYDQHKTTFNEQAWDSFSNLRNTPSIDKSKIKPSNMKNTILLFCLAFGFASMAIFFTLKYNKPKNLHSNYLNSNTQNIDTESANSAPNQNIETESANSVSLNETKKPNNKHNEKSSTNVTQQKKQSIKTDQLNAIKNKAAKKTNEVDESTVVNSNDNDLSLSDTKTYSTLKETNLNNFSLLKSGKRAQIKKSSNTKNETNTNLIKANQPINNKLSKTKIDFQPPRIPSLAQTSKTPKTNEKTTLSLTNGLKSKFQDLDKTNFMRQHTVLAQIPLKETLIKLTKAEDKISMPQSIELAQEIASPNSAKLSIGISYMLSISYNITDGGIPIRPAKKSFIHLKYIKGQYNAEAVAGFNFYETLNTNNRITRKYYTDFGLSPGINMFNNEKHCLQMNTGVYYRVFADEDLLTSKKPTRWGLMGLLGYQVKLDERGSAGLQFRVYKDYIRNIDRADQYKIQHFGLSFFMDVNLAAIPEAFRNIRKNKKKF